MIDLHSHILPGMDDGSKNVEESQALLDLLKAQGVTTVAATPHFYPHRETPEDFLQRRAACAEALGDTELPLILGAEVAYFSDMSRSAALPQLALGNTGFLLVEMPFKPWSQRIIRDICDISIRQCLIPVLAHVDRYRGREQFPKYAQELLEHDVLFQCNAEVFATFTGRLWAMKQLRRGYIHFLGSDCHNLAQRRPKLDIAAAAISGKLGSEGLNAFHAQARQLLSFE
jgi:protein-tyrosine phosphatase